jgi:hypothetical protein
MLAVNAIEAGLTQLNPIVTGVGVPVGVGVAVEDVPGCWIVKVSCALRGLISSEARMKWRPACQLGLTITLTLKVPLPLTTTLFFAELSCANCSSIISNSAVVIVLYATWVAGFRLV